MITNRAGHNTRHVGRAIRVLDADVQHGCVVSRGSLVSPPVEETRTTVDKETRTWTWPWDAPTSLT
jgi:hypothetical protein